MNKLGSIFTCSIFLLAVSCTESVSENLQPNSSASPSAFTSGNTTMTFSVESSMGENFSHYMHDAESITEKCKVSGNDLDASTYDRTNTSIAKDCFLEVEELDLYYHGASLNVKADEGMCEYVVHAPFYFWQYQAGKTNREIYKVECDTACETVVGNNCGNYYRGVGIDVTAFADFISITNDDIQPLCHFDHTQKSDLDQDENPPNCDEGKITIYTISFSDTDSDGSCNNLITDATVETTEEECAGEITSCLAGPATDLISNFPEATSQILFNEDLSAIDQIFDINSPYDKGLSSNMYIANYIRSCYDTTNDKSSVTLHDTADFKGNEIESFATLTSPSTTDDEGYFALPKIDEASDSEYEYTIYASNPFRGYGYKGKPYYGFYCLDRAFDIKAQIRVFIRDWDRTFDQSNLFLDNTSDLNQATSYMDTQASADTAGDSYDTDIPFNNIYDWDDFFKSNYSSDWAATNAGFKELYDKSTNTYTPNPLANINESSVTIINNSCTDMNSPYYEYNFPRQGL